MKPRKPIRKRSKKRFPLVTEADAWVKAIVFQRQGTGCLKCEKLKPLQAAHILAKGSHPSIRYDLDNVIGLCLACHIFWSHRDPVGFVDWIEAKFPGRIDRLRAAATERMGVDLKELICVLKQIYEDESTAHGRPPEPSPPTWNGAILSKRSQLLRLMGGNLNLPHGRDRRKTGPPRVPKTSKMCLKNKHSGCYVVECPCFCHRKTRT